MLLYVYTAKIPIFFCFAIERAAQIKRRPAPVVQHLGINMGRVFSGIAHYHNTNRYIFNLTACNGGNSKAVAITSARYAVKITVHQCWHTLQQLNPWRIVAVCGVLLEQCKQAAGRFAAWYKISGKTKAVLNLRLHAVQGALQRGVFFFENHAQKYKITLEQTQNDQKTKKLRV